MGLIFSGDGCLRRADILLSLCHLNFDGVAGRCFLRQSCDSWQSDRMRLPHGGRRAITDIDGVKFRHCCGFILAFRSLVTHAHGIAVPTPRAPMFVNCRSAFGTFRCSVMANPVLARFRMAVAPYTIRIPNSDAGAAGSRSSERFTSIASA